MDASTEVVVKKEKKKKKKTDSEESNTATETAESLPSEDTVCF